MFVQTSILRTIFRSKDPGSVCYNLVESLPPGLLDLDKMFRSPKNNSSFTPFITNSITSIVLSFCDSYTHHENTLLGQIEWLHWGHTSRGEIMGEFKTNEIYTITQF